MRTCYHRTQGHKLIYMTGILAVHPNSSLSLYWVLLKISGLLCETWKCVYYIAVLLFVVEINLHPRTLVLWLNVFQNDSTACIFFLSIFKHSSFFDFIFLRLSLAEPILFKVWERRKQVRDVGNKKKKKFNTENVRKEIFFFIAFVLFAKTCFQVK